MIIPTVFGHQQMSKQHDWMRVLGKAVLGKLSVVAMVA
jgi:hypothetical protein